MRTDIEMCDDDAASDGKKAEGNPKRRMGSLPALWRGFETKPGMDQLAADRLMSESSTQCGDSLRQLVSSRTLGLVGMKDGRGRHNGDHLRSAIGYNGPIALHNHGAAASPLS